MVRKSNNISTSFLIKLPRIQNNSYSSNNYSKQTLPISKRLNSTTFSEIGARKRTSSGNGVIGVEEPRTVTMKSTSRAGVTKTELKTQIWSIAILSGWRRRDQECSGKEPGRNIQMRKSMMTNGMIQTMMTMVVK